MHTTFKPAIPQVVVIINTLIEGERLDAKARGPIRAE